MDKREFIANIRAEREKLDAVLAHIQPADILRPGVAGEWSVKDVLAHLAMWNSRAVTLLFQAERGAKLQLPQSSAPDWADVNASDYASQKDRPLERVLADYHGAHAQLVKRLEGWHDEAMLFDQRRFPQLKGSSLADFVWGDSGEHDAEHREQIEAWLKSKA
jgi:uncharacterized protein (TIGR03083 family)